ncbi:osmotically-inducible protein OsmY [Thiogranum longum]|uniref:Osmotically-inducible protein OsmY n=1 Tax=Thiogranum longum TaxID=1537524 RepID=A0A4R1HAS4_9GAMM|nr:division/outer membrane stress-associated lipid-binding lipoprotein [Thiogranum longum]TCK19064.1 osmotically-inducible protein OsmY [Thiogranum longum]
MINNRWLAPVALLATTLLLNACAPLIVGGAATTASVAHDRRTAGTVVEDQSIELRIRSALNKDPELGKQAHINITSYNGVVLLSGEAPTSAMRERAGAIARRDKKVRRVHNEIQVAAPSSMMTRSSDSWITTKVKTAMLSVKLKGFDPTRIKVVTENGTVFLLGLVTHSEADAATEKARQVKGVQRIVKLFEYLD